MNISAKASLIVVVFALSACTMSQRSTDLPPGKYESNRSVTDANGTTTEIQNTTNVTVDRYGNKSATTEKTTTTDPKGLFNKTTSTSKTSERETR